MQRILHQLFELQDSVRTATSPAHWGLLALVDTIQIASASRAGVGQGFESQPIVNLPAAKALHTSALA